jgi:outer membrane receptor protein involved in Fe transport
MPRHVWFLSLAVAIAAAPVFGQTTPSSPAPSPTPPAVAEYVEVTATRIPEPTIDVPASITVLTSRDLRDIGATDLPTALAFAAGVDMVPGGDAGPAASVPEIWGLREFDSVLFVVDGVPRTGAFIPDFESIDLADVERIEVLRGAAPVTFGATSFNGVIHVVRREAEAARGRVEAFGGTHGSGGGRAEIGLPAWGGLRSSLALDGARQGFTDPRSSWERGHVLWRGSLAAGGGTLHFDVDGVWLNQDPASPHPRVGQDLSPLVPLDANHNPEGAFLNERRLQLGAGFERPTGGAVWFTRLAFTGTRSHDLRGFLQEVADVPDNATGYRRDLDLNEVYLDSHLAWTGRLEAVAGVDWIHGSGDATGGAFDYSVHLDGSGAPSGEGLVPDAEVRIDSRRDFAGAYGLVAFRPIPSLRLEGGLRLNVTAEKRDAGSGAEPAGGEADNERTDVRPSGSLGAVFTAWSRNSDTVRLYASYRDTFKPAVFDFGVGDAEGEGADRLLDPETARSVDGGVKGRFAGGRLDVEASAFLMDFDNLVVARTVNGLPGLENAGQTRFKGVEAQAAWRLRTGLFVRGAWSWHDARFRDYVAEFDGVPTQLAGKRLEMSPDQIGSAGLLWAPERGLLASLGVRYVGSRYLDKRNTALADAYTTLDAALGWRSGRYEARLDARNLTDERPPVAESELGDAQYYRLLARQLRLSVSARF